MTIVQATLFDYGALDSETRIVVQQRTSEIKGLMRRAASDIIDIGQKLIEVKERLERTAGYGHFGRWIKAEFGWSHDTAGRFMNVAQRFGDFPQIAESAAPSALYLLAAPSTPEGARQEALERGAAGEAITYSAARDIVSRYEDDEDEPLSAYEQAMAEQIEARQYDGLPLPTPPAESIRRQQISVITGSSESNEWYTPAHIIERARQVLGEIDLDPASCAAANAIVGAKTFCTQEQDGFSGPWFGRVWLNPPYGKEDGERETNAVRWARKLIEEYDADHVSAAILLVKAALGYNWFEELWRQYPTCLLRERVSFMRPDGSDDGQAKHATALLYLGPNVTRFYAVFSPVGRVILSD